jgi:plasmid stabilization system protein ParE
MNYYEIELSEDAKQSLLEISEYIALDNPARAKSFIKEILTSIQNTLSLFPYSGRLVEDLDFDEEIRIWSYGNYNCYYLVNEEKVSVEVLFVFNASRDVNLHM